MESTHSPYNTTAWLLTTLLRLRSPGTQLWRVRTLVPSHAAAAAICSRQSLRIPPVTIVAKARCFSFLLVLFLSFDASHLLNKLVYSQPSKFDKILNFFTFIFLLNSVLFFSLLGLRWYRVNLTHQKLERKNRDSLYPTPGYLVYHRGMQTRRWGVSTWGQRAPSDNPPLF